MRRIILATILMIIGVFIFSLLSNNSSSKTPLLNPFIQLVKTISPTPTLKPITKTTLLLTGDVMLGRSVNTQTKRSGDPYFPFRKTQPLLSGADITLINLEAPLFDPCPDTDTGMIFCAPTSAVEALSWAGVDVANITNNHIRNYQEPGYQSTLKTLDSNHIFPSDSTHFILVPKNNYVFGFIGFDLVSGRPSLEEIEKTIRQAKSQVDLLVVSFHWGQEYSVTVTDQQTKYGHLAVDSGADVVVGTHPHVVEPIENYKGAPIFYSLGNFVFDQMWSDETKKGLVVQVTFTDKKITEVRTIPIHIVDYGQAQVYGTISVNTLWP